MTWPDARNVLQMPGLGRACVQAADCVANGRSVLVVTGPWLDPAAVADALLGATALQDYLRQPLWTSTAKAPLLALEELIEASQAFGTEDSLDSFAVIVLEGFESLSQESQRAWYLAMETLAKDSQSARVESGRTSPRRLPPVLLCHRGCSSPELPATNVALEVIRLPRSLTLLDVRFLVRERCRLDAPQLGAWREFVLPALAGTDLELLDSLWEDCVLGLESIVSRCRELARNRGWNGANDSREDGATGDDVTGRFLWTYERGRIVNLVLAVGQGDTVEVGRRLWRGQAELLLPRVDEIRIRVCAKLQEALGDGWPCRWCPPSDPDELRLVSESHFHSQFGHLRRVVRHQDVRLNRNLRDSLLQVIDCTRKLRNELAHYRPVSFETYMEFDRTVQRASNVLGVVQ